MKNRTNIVGMTRDRLLLYEISYKAHTSAGVVYRTSKKEREPAAGFPQTLAPFVLLLLVVQAVHTERVCARWGAGAAPTTWKISIYFRVKRGFLAN